MMLATVFDTEKLVKEKQDIEEKLTKVEVYTSLDLSITLSKRNLALKKVLDEVADAQNLYETLSELYDLYDGQIPEEDAKSFNQSLQELKSKVNKLYVESLYSGDTDNNDAIVEIHSGAGGEEAQDWASMLYRMYQRYCETRGYAVSELDMLAGDEAGIKSVTFIAKGENAYGYLKAEKGVHRLVRISPFDANSRRHTSFASVEVMPEILEATDIVIRPEDLKVDTYRSSGAGGQHVNKTESAIRITHIPTGIVVACQNERSQIQNRETAMSMLRSKLAELAERKQMEEAAAIKGDVKKIEWGSQIRSYVFCPYTLVKDHRTGYENPQVQKVMDGDIHDFIVEYLKRA